MSLKQIKMANANKCTNTPSASFGFLPLSTGMERSGPTQGIAMDANFPAHKSA